MKASFFLSIFFCFIPLFVFAQIPQSPNAFDAEGNKHGRWTYTYSPSWNLTEDPDSLAYYRLITYEHGVPQGVVRDYYLSGAIQWEGNLLADEPEEVMDGGCAWYYEDGQKKEEAAYRHGIVNGSFRSWFPNGQLAVEGQYQNGVKEGNWAYWDEQGNLLMKKNFTPGEGMSGQELNQKMANAYRRGDYETALSWGEKALRRAETRFGKQHENYTTSLNNLFLIYYNMGLYEKAEPLLLESRQILATLLGKEHPDHVISLYNLAALYESMGSYEKAEPLYLESLEITAKALGKEHPDYGASLNNLARLYTNMGLYEKAEPLYLESRQITAKVLGKEHPDYATSLDNLAVLYHSIGLYEKAEPLYLESRQIRAKALGTEHLDYATSLNNLAELYRNMGLYEKAEPLYLESLEITVKALGKEHPNYATSLNNLAGLYQSMGLYEKAEPLYLESRQITVKALGKEHPDYAASLHSLAVLYRNMGLYEKAEPLYLESLEITGKALGKEHPDYAAIVNNLAGLYTNMGLYRKAEPLYLESLEIKVKALGKEHPDYGTSLHDLAELYKSMSLYEKAEPLYLESLEITVKALGKEHPNYATSLNNLAGLYQSMGLYEKAEPLYLESLEITVKALGKEHPNYATSLNNLAGLYQSMGLYEKAGPLYLESQQVTVKTLGKEHPTYGTSLNNVAGLYQSMGLYEKVEPLLLESRQITVKALGKEHPNYAASLNNLAELYQSMGLYEKAEPLYLESRQIRAKALGTEHPDYAASLHSLAVLYRNMGLYEKAEPLYLESRQITVKALGKEHPDYAAIVNNLAGLYTNMGLYRKAEPLYLESLEIKVKALGKEHPDYTASLHNLALLYQSMGLYEKAESLFIKGTNAFLTQLSRYYPGLNEAEKLRFLKSKIEFQFQCYYAFALHHSDDFPGLLPVMMNLNLASKGLSLSTATNAREAILQSNDTGLLKLYKQWLIQRRQIAQTIALSINERNKRGINLGVLEARADSLEKILRLNSQSLADQFETTRYQWQDVQNSLEENEVSISFLDFPYYNGKEWTDSTYYVALAVRPEDEHPQLVKLCLARDLKKFLNYKKADERDTYIADSEAAYQLYQLIWAPLLPYIKERTAVHYSPSGLLNRIAFQILTDSEGKRLNEEYSLNQYTTIRDFVRLRKQKNEANALTVASFGGSNFDQALDGKTDKEKPEITNGQSHTFNLPRGLNERTKSWPYLTGTLKEASNIVDLFGSSGWEPQLFQGALATESNLKQLSGNSPCILHIATHGFFLKPQEQKVLPGSSQDPLLFKYKFYKPRPQGFGEIVPFIQHPLLRSGLIFTGANHAWQGKKVPEGMDDGILTAYEIVNLDLRNTELVVLSACETGLGDIESTEGVFGLQRAFKQAGVNKVIMSLWKIPDAETVEFMEAFYGKYLGGQTIREAFVGAQREMAGRYEPYYWAGFVLVE